MPVATIKFDSEFLGEAMKRCRAQSQAKVLGLAIKLGALAILAPMSFWLFRQGFRATGICFAFIGVFMFFAHHVDYWWAKRSFRNSPFLDDVLRIEFTAEGFHAKSEKQEVKLQWPVFTKVAHFRDGFLLFQGPKLANWIPFSSLESPGQADDLERLLREKIKDHVVAIQWVRGRFR
jgi:hypothetical protein